MWKFTVSEEEGQKEQLDDREIQAAPVATGSKAARAADRAAFKQARAIQSGEADDGPIRYRLPDHKNRELFAIADQLLGASKLIVMCEDGKSRLARIPGKMKRRQWIKPGDLIVVKPWEIDDDKADVKHRYLRIQSSHLSRRRLIPELLDHGF
jgi:translation initiation factor 1A